MGATDFPDLYDTDILVLEKVIKRLNERARATMDMEAFRKEAVERFQDAGFEVDVKVWYTNEPGVFAFDMEVVGKIGADEPFDHERMHHEVTHDVLGIDGKGTIDANGMLRDPK